MTPGEIHGLHARVVADLKEQLAAAQEEASQQRTRAEAAEQELREERERANSGEWVEKAHAETLEGAAEEAQQEVEEVASALGRWKPLRDSVGAAANEMVNELQAMQAKIARIRAHLPALKRLHAWVSSPDMGSWGYTEGSAFCDDVQEMAEIAKAALEAMEP